MKSPNRYFTLTSICIGLASVGSLNAAEILSETFTAGQRLTQNLPSTSAWYGVFSSGISDSTGNLVSSSNRHTVSYFTSSGSPVELAVGQSLTTSVTFSLDTPTASTTGFRIGLFDSSESRATDDSTGTNNAVYTDYAGYGAFFNINATTALRLYERDSGISGKLINGNDAYSELLGDTGTGTTFGNGTDYTANITLQRLASGMQITVALSGVAGYQASYLDTTGKTTFDSIAVFGSSSMAGFTLKDVSIAVIPEPSVASFWMGTVAFSLMGFHLVRRRAR